MNTFISDYPAISWSLVAALGVLALIPGAYLLVVVRRLRRDQKIVLGKEGHRDLVAHARALEQRLDGLNYDLKRLAQELSVTDKRLDSCLTFRSVVRYDAYRDLSGMQSTSVALLDAHFSGIIISAIQSRDHARIYVKDVRHGESREKLSPEEEQVFKEAMGLKAIETYAETAEGGVGG
jgi:hypothetical protein